MNLFWVGFMQATVDYLNIRTKFGIVRSLKLMISDDFSSIYDERMSDEMEFEVKFRFRVTFVVVPKLQITT